MDFNDYYDEFEKFAEGRDLNSEEEFDKAFDEFIKSRKIIPFAAFNDAAEDAYDYLDMAEEATSRTQALKYVKKALELEPDNFDAQLALAELSSDSSEKLIKKYRELIADANAKMKADGWFSEKYIGEFWGFHETRPYMRLRIGYIEALILCSMHKFAVEECKDLLRLSLSDNLGVRYRLMHLYAYFEDEESAKALLKEYNEKSTMFLLPLSILYYRRGNFTEAAKYLRELKKKNGDTLEFFDSAVDGTIFERLEDAEFDAYRPFTFEEFVVAMKDNPFLYTNSREYFIWGAKKLRTTNKKN